MEAGPRGVAAKEDRKNGRRRLRLRLDDSPSAVFNTKSQPERLAPGKPNQNAFIERFNKTYRNEVPSAYQFKSIEQVQQ